MGKVLLVADADGAAPTLSPAATAAIVDVFVYVVVLNLFVQYVPRVITETFTLSLLTAALLKVVLEVVLLAKNRLKGRFSRASTPRGKVAAGLLLWVVVFASKFVILELVSFVFQGSVELGGFVSVWLLVLTLLVARAGVRWLLRASGARQ